MILFHGSNVVVEVPLLVPQVRMLDFGSGFYTTTNREQAESFARKVAERRNSPFGCVSVYEIAELDVLSQELDILTFESPNEAWLDFVFANRNGSYLGKSYDAIFGPVANDTIFRTFAAYDDGILTRQETIARLKVRKLFNQMTFCTERALKCLQFIEYYEVTKEVNQ
jgi:hypothetical protein